MDESHNNKGRDDVPEHTGVGSLLRKSREERNIDLDEAVDVTRIRRHYLEALENEEWSKLPSQAFIKGFLRSYAEFLGLDEEMVRDYYQKVSLSQTPEPHVLKEIEPQPGRWHLISIIPVLALALIAAIILQRGAISQFFGKPFQYLKTQSIAEREDRPAEPVEEEDSALQDDKENEGLFSPDEEPVEREVEREAEVEIALESEPFEDDMDLDEPTTPVDEVDETALLPQFTLTADVMSETWIAMYIDDEPVREYLLQPGQNVRWTADKGFYILVGNAGGIKFFLNGTEVEQLGPEGKVVRVKLPEGYE